MDQSCCCKADCAPSTEFWYVTFEVDDYRTGTGGDHKRELKSISSSSLVKHAYCSALGYIISGLKAVQGDGVP